MTQSVDYRTLPLDRFTVRDLTDALGVDASAKLLDTSRRAIYTTRNTNRISVERILKMIDAIKADEHTCRMRLVITRNLKAARAEEATA